MLVLARRPLDFGVTTSGLFLPSVKDSSSANPLFSSVAARINALYMWRPLNFKPDVSTVLFNSHVIPERVDVHRRLRLASLPGAWCPGYKNRSLFETTGSIYLKERQNLLPLLEVKFLNSIRYTCARRCGFAWWGRCMLEVFFFFLGSFYWIVSLRLGPLSSVDSNTGCKPKF